MFDDLNDRDLNNSNHWKSYKEMPGIQKLSHKPLEFIIELEGY
jgi:hypothetical protein